MENVLKTEVIIREIQYQEPMSIDFKFFQTEYNYYLFCLKTKLFDKVERLKQKYILETDNIAISSGIRVIFRLNPIYKNFDSELQEKDIEKLQSYIDNNTFAENDSQEEYSFRKNRYCLLFNFQKSIIYKNICLPINWILSVINEIQLPEIVSYKYRNKNNNFSTNNIKFLGTREVGIVKYIIK